VAIDMVGRRTAQMRQRQDLQIEEARIARRPAPAPWCTWDQPGKENQKAMGHGGLWAMGVHLRHITHYIRHAANCLSIYNISRKMGDFRFPICV
jgi:hypothetical protein